MSAVLEVAQGQTSEAEQRREAQTEAEQRRKTQAEAEQRLKVAHVSAPSLDTDKAALIALYHITNGPQWINNKGWLTDAPISEWHGVTVEGGRVVKLNLPSNNLQGKSAFM